MHTHISNLPQRHRVSEDEHLDALGVPFSGRVKRFLDEITLSPVETIRDLAKLVCEHRAREPSHEADSYVNDTTAKFLRTRHLNFSSKSAGEIEQALHNGGWSFEDIDNIVVAMEAETAKRLA